MTNLHKQLAIIVSSLLVAGIYLTLRPTVTPTPQTATVAELTTNTNGTTDLKMEMVSDGLHWADEAVSIKLSIEGRDHVTGAKVEIKYDPSYLDFVSIVPPERYTMNLVSVQNNTATGTLTANYGIDNSSHGIYGALQLGQIQFTAKKAGTTSLTFGDGTTITGTSNPDANVVKSANNLDFAIQPSATSSPNPTVLGDLDGDGHVGLSDYNKLVAGYGTTYSLADYNKLIANYGK